MNKKFMCLCIVLIVLIIVIIKINTKKNTNMSEVNNNEYHNEVHKDKEEQVELSKEEEKYYKEKQEEFGKAEDEYEEVITEYIGKMFNGEEKKKLEEYNKKMTDAVNNNNKQAKIAFSDEKIAYIKEISEKRFSEEQLKKLSDIQNRIDTLEPIVNEYQEKLVKIEEKQYWEGRETLKDGSIVNNRNSVISDKECNGLKFTNLSMKYIPSKKCTKFGATVTNNSKQIKEGKVSVKVTGDVETIFPITIERLAPGEYYDFEIEVQGDISMAGELGFVK